ncbi:hypothetical protein [Novosphingobium sp.]|uniref:hypothetical protein n=1 Tax=Novosphingobium sp. TaxID=1874826 RepID=UPI003BAB83BA
MTAPAGNLAETIARLARAPSLRERSPLAQDVILAIRLCALAARDGSDPLPALALRLRHCEAAFAVHELIRTVTRHWPEPFGVGRACCQRLSPDEVTLARMVEAGQGRSHADFMRTIDGFVPAAAHEPLWEACTHAVVLMG